MDLKTYQEKTYVRIKEHESEKDTILNWMVGLSEEVGEVANHLKHYFWGEEKKVDLVELSKEMGDVLWYLSALATMFGIDLDTVAEINKAKLEFRYKDKTCEEASAQRKATDVKFTDTEEYKEMVKKLWL